MALADRYREYGYDDHSPSRNNRSKSSVEKQTQQKEKTSVENKSYLSKLDRMLIILTVVFCLGCIVSGVKIMADTFAINQENYELQAEIEELTKTNKDLEDTVSQLTMSETVINAANEQGLSMNEDNVKVAE